MAEENRKNPDLDEGVEIPVETDEPAVEEAEEKKASEEETQETPDPEKDQANDEPSDAEPEKPEETDSTVEAGEGDSTDEAGEGDSAASPPEGEEGKDGKSGLFGRRKKDKEKEKLKSQIEELNDRLRRSLAEFDNYRKRTEKEKASMYVIGARDIVEKMLPVVDSFERGLSTAPEDDPFADGMRMIYKQMMTALEEAGVSPIEAVGQPFDPNLHNAVMHVEDEEAGENMVVEEFQKGYMYKDFVVRHSMVKVAN